MADAEKKSDNGADASLVEEILAGRRDRFSEVISRYQKRIYSIAWSYTRNSEAASDLTQDALIAVFNSLPRFDKTRSLTNWVLKIAVYHCYQYLRKNRRPTLELPLELPGNDPSPLDVQVESEQRSEVLKSFNLLPEDLKMTVWLFYFLDRSCKEISEILEISNELVKIRLFRARKAMGEHLKNIVNN